MFAEISIYWKNDINELMLLPDAEVFTSGSDGMQVIGKEDEIEKLRDAVNEHPDCLEYNGIEILNNAELQECFENLRQFSHQSFTDDSGTPLDDIGMFERLGAEKHDYYLCYYRTPRGTRMWYITGSLEGDGLVAHEEIEAFTTDIAEEIARQNFDLDGWVEHGIIFSNL
jgi:hypothetical protein